MTTHNQRGRYGRYVGNLLTLSDFIIVNAVFAMVVVLNPPAWPHQAKLVGLLMNIAYIPAALWLRGVRDIRSIRMDRIMLDSVRAVGTHALFFFSLLFFLDVDTPDQGVFLELYISLILALPCWWILSRIILKSIRRRGRNFLRVAIVGTGPTALRLYNEIMSDPGFGFRMIGFVDHEMPKDFPFPDLYAGSLDDFDTIVRQKAVDHIYYTLSGEDIDAFRQTITIADNNMAQFFFVPGLTRYMAREFRMGSIGAVPVMWTNANPLSSIVSRSIKRFFDILVSGAFLVISPVIFIPVALAIKISSPGPVFFRQKRTGYKGREFVCLKFRTMRVNVDADTCQATKDDPRKTRLGDFLRRTSIDELPQFINVFKGDMSVVGPRPHMLAHTEQYSHLIDKYMARHIVKPGITGWAQVNGYRGRTEALWQMERRVEFDVWYIEHWSLMLDVKIVLRTIINAFHGEENAF